MTCFSTRREQEGKNHLREINATTDKKLSLYILLYFLQLVNKNHKFSLKLKMRIGIITTKLTSHLCSGLDEASLVAEEADEIDDVSGFSSTGVPEFVVSGCLVVLDGLIISLPRTVATILVSELGDNVVEEV